MVESSLIYILVELRVIQGNKGDKYAEEGPTDANNTLTASLASLDLATLACDKSTDDRRNEKKNRRALTLNFTKKALEAKRLAEEIALQTTSMEEGSEENVEDASVTETEIEETEELELEGVAIDSDTGEGIGVRSNVPVLILQTYLRLCRKRRTKKSTWLNYHTRTLSFRLAL